MGLINGKVSLEYNYELWKKMYEDEKNELIDIFKNEKFKYDHIGSTSIKNLYAKPIVDIAVGVNSIDNLSKYIDILETKYTIKYNNDYDELLLIKEKNNETFFLIHILPINSKRYIDLIRFRDILNNNPKILKEYQELKFSLLKKYASNRELYTKGKNDFIQNVLINNN